MILILSESDDDSTNAVIDWINYLGEESVRINRDEHLPSSSPKTSIELDWASCNLSIACDENSELDLQRVSAIWFRRSFYPYLDSSISVERLSTEMNARIEKNLYYDYQNFSSFLFSRLQYRSKRLGNFKHFRLNKLEILDLAKHHGIDIPATLVTNSKSHVREFMDRKGTIITKSISEVFDIRVEDSENSENGDVFLNYTEEITPTVFESMSDSFAFSLFQEKLDKELEIRCFYLDGAIYSMAIFSQLDAATSIDFRKYTNNRRVPYQLPAELETKIKKLMTAIDLNTGSIDLVRTKDSRLVFLEINPTGQFGMTSYPCNYHLDQKIAEYLTQHEQSTH